MIKILPFIFVYLLSSLAFADQVNGLESEKKGLDWKKVKDKDGIQVYRAHSETSRLKTVKAVTRMEIENIQSFAALLLDGNAYYKWIHMVGESKISETDNPSQYEFFLLTKLPWPVKDRILQSRYVITQEADYSIRFELNPTEVPLEERGGAISVPESTGYYELKPIPDTKEVVITAEFFVDPGGYVPAFFINIITDDMSYFTTKKMRRYIAGDKYQDFELDFLKRRPWVLPSTS